MNYAMTSSSCPATCPAACRFRKKDRCGVVLMEVVFALALFVGGAAVILNGLSASTRAALRVQAEAVADDLVITLMSEIRMKLTPVADDGPNDYEEPYLGWTWQTVVSEFQDTLGAEGPEMTRVEVIVANEAAGCERRITLMLPAEDEQLILESDEEMLP